MYGHVTLGTNDCSRAEKFYDAVMAVLDHPPTALPPELLRRLRPRPRRQQDPSRLPPHGRGAGL